MYGKYRTAPEGATLAEKSTNEKWVDLYWVDPARHNTLVYVCTRPNPDAPHKTQI